MAFLYIPAVRLKGVAACVPSNIIDNYNLNCYSDKEADQVIPLIGVKSHRKASSDICTSDLCYYASKKLMDDLNWAPSDVDCLILVTQSPDYILPATSNILQYRLGLKEEIFNVDITGGCAGWIQGMQVMASLISHGGMKRGILLSGDTTLKFCSPEDKSTYPLFGDAGTATALEFDESSEGFKFHTATDGKSHEAIIIPDGGFRNMSNPESFILKQVSQGIKRNRFHVILDGMNVLAFSISKAPESIMKLANEFKLDISLVDYFLLHQANLFINERIRKKLAIPAEKVPYSISEYGNTGPGSIPLTMVSKLSKELESNKNISIIACGFGTGLSWGSLHFCAANVVCSDIIEI